MSRPSSAPFLLLLLLLSCTGCRSQAPGSARETSSRVPCVDMIDRRVDLPRHPARIISLAPDITETLFLLGAGDRVIGVTTQCSWPEAARRKPKIGDLLNPNNEVILAARPDLVISSTAGNDRAAVMKLASLGLPVYVVAPRTVEKIFESLERIGRITDCEPRSQQLAAGMKRRLADVKQRLAGLPPVRAFLITWYEPLLTPGRNTFENDVLRLAGVQSISSDIADYYPRYSLEQVLVKDPDAILTVEHQGDLLPDLRQVAGWKDLRAVRERKVYTLSEFLQHPSPLFVEGVEDLARKLHPERFR